MKQGNNDQKGSFQIRCLIRHPSAKLSFITEGMGYDPDVYWEVGSLKKTPSGRYLDHKNVDTMWTKIFMFPGRRDFFACAKNVLDDLAIKGDFINQLHKMGGSIKIIVDVSGKDNSGDMLPHSLINLITELEVEFGLEVYNYLIMIRKYI